jgi:hypothetical protein
MKIFLVLDSAYAIVHKVLFVTIWYLLWSHSRAFVATAKDECALILAGVGATVPGILLMSVASAAPVQQDLVFTSRYGGAIFQWCKNSPIAGCTGTNTTCPASEGCNSPGGSLLNLERIFQCQYGEGGARRGSGRKHHLDAFSQHVCVQLFNCLCNDCQFQIPGTGLEIPQQTRRNLQLSFVVPRNQTAARVLMKTLARSKRKTIVAGRAQDFHPTTAPVGKHLVLLFLWNREDEHVRL